MHKAVYIIVGIFLLLLLLFGATLYAGGMSDDPSTGRELLVFFVFIAVVAGAVFAIRKLMDRLRSYWEGRWRR